MSLFRMRQCQTGRATGQPIPGTRETLVLLSLSEHCQVINVLKLQVLNYTLLNAEKEIPK